MRKPGSPAFSMIEVAVAIAVMAILAGAVAPLALKALNQQREQKTRDSLKIAYEALYGASDRRVSNMTADFGFIQNPAGANWVDLEYMTTRTQPNGAGVVPQPYGAGGAIPFFWGWNGPYWTGSTTPAANTNGLPVDGWGRVIRLYNGPKLVSAGVDGVYGTADDLTYPPVVGIQKATLYVNMIRQNPGSPGILAVGSVTVTITHRAAGAVAPPLAVWQPNWPASNSTQTNKWNPNAGPVSISITTPSIASSQQVIDLMPGQTQVIDFKFTD